MLAQKKFAHILSSEDNDKIAAPHPFFFKTFEVSDFFGQFKKKVAHFWDFKTILIWPPLPPRLENTKNERFLFCKHHLNENHTKLDII